VESQDAFHDNFLVQWHPESMRTMTTPVSHPHVYLIDFEVAIEFPVDCPPTELVCTGFPLGGSFPLLEMYSRPLAPEMTTGEPYSPFKTDVWQLAISFYDFRVCNLLYFLFSYV
jgi:serine/threonine protein kinase